MSAASPLSFATVAVIAGLLGSAITSGIHYGQLVRGQVEHERRLDAQDRHMERIDDDVVELASLVAVIKDNVSWLVGRARAEEPYPGIVPRTGQNP